MTIVIGPQEALYIAAPIMLLALLIAAYPSLREHFKKKK